MNSREESGHQRRENELGVEIDKQKLQAALEQSWTSETSSVPNEWNEGQASRGQCVPTALVAQDYLGGDLQKLTTVFNGREESHYRNVLADGTIFDASRSQCPKGQDLQIANIALKGFGSIRDKRLSEPETARRYALLKQRVARNLSAAIGNVNPREELEQASSRRNYDEAATPQPKSTVFPGATPGEEGLIDALRHRLRTIVDTTEYANDGGMMQLALAECAMILANCALDGGDLDWDYPTVYAGISGEFRDTWQKVEEARVATHAALQALRNFEQKL